METIAYIGMDVHTTNYTLCGFTVMNDTPFGRTQINPDLKELERYLKTLHKQRGITHFVCGYEAGCLGYSLYHQIMNHAWKDFTVECFIIAPTTIPMQMGRIKTDKQDARGDFCLCDRLRGFFAETACRLYAIGGLICNFYAEFEDGEGAKFKLAT